MTQSQEELREIINQELGRISGVFMSQGDTRAGDIVMPTEELLKSSERILSAISLTTEKIRGEERERMRNTVYGMLQNTQSPNVLATISGAKDVGYRKALSDVLQALSNPPIE